MPGYTVYSIVGALCVVAFAMLAFTTLVSIFQRDQGRRDFVVFWATGQQLVHHANPYDYDALLKMERAAGMPPFIDAMYMRNPPFALPLVYWLGFFGMRGASLFWSALLAFCFAISVYLLWKMHGGAHRARQWLGYTFAPAWYCLLTAQSSHFALLGLVLFLRWHRSRPYLAGIALWLCMLKPQLFLPFGIVLIAWLAVSRNYRAVIGFAAILLASVGITYLIDPYAWAQYAQMVRLSKIQTDFIPCASTLLRAWINPRWVWLQFALPTVASIWALLHFWPRRTTWDWVKQDGNLVLLISLLCAPYSWIYDAGIVLPALLYGVFTTRSKNMLMIFALLSAYVEVALFGHAHHMSGFYDWTLWCALAWPAWFLIAGRLKEDPTAVKETATALDGREAAISLQPHYADAWRFWRGPVIIITLVAFWAIVPLLVMGPSNGDDLAFHLTGWVDVKHLWQQGVFYPHWAPSAAFRAGEPRFVFYPPLSWMLGAGLGLLFAWKTVSPVFIFLILAATGLATYRLAREVLDKTPSIVAGCVALASGYSLYATYTRAAFGEMFGGFLIPLLLLFLSRPSSSNSSERRLLDAPTVLLSLVFAGIFLSNIPLSIMACYFSLAVAILSSAMERSWAPIFRALKAMVIGASLCGFYLAPVIWERQWITTAAIHGSPMLKLENRMFNPFILPYQIAHRYVDPKLYIPAFAMMLVAAVSALVCWRRGIFSSRRSWWLSLALIAPVLFVLQFPFSLPVWHLLPALHLLQFPWRWLVVLEAPMAILFVAAVWPRGGWETIRRTWLRKTVLAVVSVLFAVAIFFSDCYFYRVDPLPGGTTLLALVLHHYNIGIAPAEEYTPIGASDETLKVGLPDGCITDHANQALTPRLCQKIVSADIHGETMRLQTSADNDGFVILRLRNYPAWQVMLNGHGVSNLPRRDDGLIAVPVTPGPIDISVAWKTTGDVVIGRWISAVACVWLLAYGWLAVRKRSPSAVSADAAVEEARGAEIQLAKG